MMTAGKGIVLSSIAGGFPAIVPSSVLGSASPGNRINIGAIGNGRISRVHDLPGIWKHDAARFMAVCDLDSRRVEDARALVNGHYGDKTGKRYDGVTTYSDYRELLGNKDVDAVVISTPDHWRAIIAIHAVEAGKDVYLQKPASLTIAEGRALSDAVHRSGRIFQIGSLNFNASTGTPYSIMTGRDGNGDLVYNDRPAGLGRNTQWAPGQWTVNGNFFYTLAIGKRTVQNPGGITGITIRDGVANVMTGGPAPPRYRIGIAANIQNLTNHTNYTGYIGTMTSPFFLQPQNVLNSRKVDISLNFSF